MTTPPTTSSDRSPPRAADAPRAALAHSSSGPRAAGSRHDSQVRYFGSNLKILPGVTLPLQSMLVTDTERALLISPVGTPEEAAHIAAAPVTLIAPSLLHHLHLPAAIERFRPVALWGPPGLAHKRPELGPVHVFGVDAWPHRDLLEVAVIEGAPVRNEVVFFHPASRTIYTADLFFNVREPEGALTSLAMRLLGVHRRFAAAKQWRRWVTDRAAFTRSIEEVLAWDFERIAMAHGDPIEDRAHDRFEIALRELGLLE